MQDCHPILLPSEEKLKAKDQTDLQQYLTQDPQRTGKIF